MFYYQNNEIVCFYCQNKRIRLFLHPKQTNSFGFTPKTREFGCVYTQNKRIRKKIVPIMSPESAPRPLPGPGWPSPARTPRSLAFRCGLGEAGSGRAGGGPSPLSPSLLSRLPPFGWASPGRGWSVWQGGLRALAPLLALPLLPPCFYEVERGEEEGVGDQRCERAV